jgi:hypothetical protein
MIALDLDDADEALALARRVVDQTGRSVILREAGGEIIATIQSSQALIEPESPSMLSAFSLLSHDLKENLTSITSPAIISDNSWL